MNRRLLTALFGAALLASAVAPAFAAPKPAVWQPPSAGVAEPRASWTYSGCWSRSGAGDCVDIYRDANGQAWECKACRMTKSPGPGKCKPISQAALDAGRWCS